MATPRTDRESAVRATPGDSCIWQRRRRITPPVYPAAQAQGNGCGQVRAHCPASNVPSPVRDWRDGSRVWREHAIAPRVSRARQKAPRRFAFPRGAPSPTLEGVPRGLLSVSASSAIPTAGVISLAAHCLILPVSAPCRCLTKIPEERKRPQRTTGWRACLIAALARCPAAGSPSRASAGGALQRPRGLHEPCGGHPDGAPPVACAFPGRMDRAGTPQPRTHEAWSRPPPSPKGSTGM